MTAHRRPHTCICAAVLMVSLCACAPGSIEGDSPNRPTSTSQTTPTHTTPTQTTPTQTTPDADVGTDTDQPDTEGGQDTFDNTDTVDEPDTVETSQVDRVHLDVNATTLRVGYTAALRWTALDRDGQPLTNPPSATVEVTDPSILTTHEHTLTATTQGTTQVTVRIGDVVSNPVDLTVLTAPEASTPQGRIHPQSTTLAVGQTHTFTASVRGASRALETPSEQTWHSSDPSVLEITPEGVATALQAGDAEVWTAWPSGESARSSVRVTHDETWVSATLLSPSQDAATRGQLFVHVLPERRVTGSTSSFGEPFQPNSATVLVNGVPSGSLSGDLLSASGWVDLSAQPPGLVTLQVRVDHQGTQTTTDPVQVLRLPDLPTENLFEPLIPIDAASWQQTHGERGLLWIAQGTVHFSALECGRSCPAIIRSLNPESLSWSHLEYQRHVFKEVSGTLTEVEETSRYVDIPRYVGWGWNPTAVRDVHAIPSNDEVLIAWSNQDARTAFNLADEPERYWFDCHVARWDSTAGWDAQGGWRLFSSENPAYKENPPHPDDLGWDIGLQRHPAGADAVRSEDCSTPKLLKEDTGETVLSFIATELPGERTKLRTRRWDGSAWSDAVDTLDLNHPGATLHAFLQTPSGAWVASVDTNGSQARIFWRDESGWTPDTTPLSAHQLIAYNNQLAAVSLQGGDLRVWSGDRNAWAPLGAPLDVQPWATVHEANLIAHNDRLLVVWSEGPEEGDRQIYAALWTPEDAAWQRISQTSLQLEPNSFDPQVLLDPDGHLFVRYSTPNDPEADDRLGAYAYIQRVLRTQTPFFNP